MNWKQNMAVLGVYALLTVLMTWPVAGQLSTHVAGDGGDPWQTLWRFGDKQHAAEQAIQEGRLLPFVGEEFLGLTGPHLVNISVWPWMPLHAFFGEPVGYNLVWLASFVLAGYGMYLLVRYISHQTLESPQIDLAAFLAGVTYMFLPFHVAQSMGHFGAMQIMWLPFIILVGLLWLKKPTTGKTILLSLLVIVQAWTEHHYILWLGVFALMALALRWRVFAARIQSQKSVVLRQGALLGALLFAGVVMAMLPTLRLATQEGSGLDLGDDQLIRFSADLFSFITPAQFHPIWGGAFFKLFSHDFTGNVSEATQYLGITVLLILVFFSRPVPKVQKQFWITVGVVFLVISLGPLLHVFGTVTSIPLPYALVKDFPVIDSVRAVARAGVFVGLAVSVLFGLTLSKQLHRKGSAAVLLVVLLLEFAFLPVPMQSAKLSPAYAALSQEAGSAVIEIPAATNYTIASRSLYASLEHKKEVVGNIALERALDPAKLELTKRIPGVKQMLFLRTTELRENRKEFFDQDITETLLDAMTWLDAETIVIHRDSISILQDTAIRNVVDNADLFSRQSFDDVMLYTRTASAYGDGVLLVRNSGWENIGYDKDRDAVFAEVPTAASADVINTSGIEQTIRLEYEKPPESPLDVTMQYDGTPVLPGAEIRVTPGIHTVTFTAQGDGKGIIMNPRLVVTPL